MSRLRRFAMAIVVIAGALLFLPALRTTFMLDDYMHTAMIEGNFCGTRGPFELYDFVRDEDRAALTDRGLLPWWSHPELRIRFFRPLSSALRWTEQRAVGIQPLAFHLHSFAWWLGAAFAARWLYRRLLGEAADAKRVILPSAIFALGPWHVVPLAWVANREVLISVAFGALGLGAYATWREGRRARDALVAALLFGVAVLAGEYALCFAGYVLAYEVVRRRESLLRRAVGVLPFAVPVTAYLAVHYAGRYGSYGSAFYADPVHEPGAYLRLAPMRLMTYLGQEWLTLGNGAWGTSAPRWLIVTLVLAMAAVALLPMKRALAALREGPRRAVLWMTMGSLLSLAPVLAVQPAPRVLAVSALGMALAVAILLDHAWFGDVPARGRVAALTSLAATALGFAQLVHGPVASFLSAREAQRSAQDFAESAVRVRAHVARMDRAELVVVRGMAAMFFGPFSLDRRGEMPARWRVLSHTSHVLVLRRDPRTIEIVAPAEQALFPAGPGNLFRNEAAVIRNGDVFRVPGMTVTVLDTTAHGPRRARVEFDRELESEGYVWTDEGFEGLREVKIPKVGFGAPFDP